MIPVYQQMIFVAAAWIIVVVLILAMFRGAGRD